MLQTPLLDLIKVLWEQPASAPPSAGMVLFEDTPYYYGFNRSQLTDLSSLNLPVCTRDQVKEALIKQLTSIGTVTTEDEIKLEQTLAYIYSHCVIVSLAAGDLVLIKPGVIGILTIRKPLIELIGTDTEDFKKTYVEILDDHWDSNVAVARDQQIVLGLHGGITFTLLRNSQTEAVCMAEEISDTDAFALLREELAKLQLAPSYAEALFDGTIEYLTKVHGCRFQKGLLPGLGFYCVGFQGVIRCSAAGIVLAN